MLFHPTSVAGAHLIELEKRGDDRGFFARTFCTREFDDQQLVTQFVQVNNSLSADVGTLRGMHYQLGEHAETKIVRCISGSLWDCIVDIRPESPTYGQWFGAELSSDNRLMMYAPKGVAHGFVTLEPDTEAFYFVDAFYAPQAERGLRWNDPTFAIEWPIGPKVISEKDAQHPDFDRAYHLCIEDA